MNYVQEIIHTVGVKDEKMKKIILILIIGILLISLVGAINKDNPNICSTNENLNQDLCNLNQGICENVCGGKLIKRCTTDVPPSVCETVCLR